MKLSLFKSPKHYFTKYLCGLYLKQVCIYLAYLIWWNSQSWWTSQPLVVKIAIPSSAGLLLILSIIACYCCCCRASGSRGGVVGRQTTFAIPSKFPLHNPAENQFNYKTQVNVTNVNA